MARPSRSSSSTKTRSVIRTDHLVVEANRGKVEDIRALLALHRRAAKLCARIQWSIFETKGFFDPHADALTDHRKKTVEVRSRLIGLLARHHDVPLQGTRKDRDKRRPPCAPGLEDPLEVMKKRLGAAHVQMVRAQVVGILDSFLSNRKNDFVETVFSSSIDEKTRHALFVVDKAHAWFRLTTPVFVDGREVSKDVRRLAKRIMSHVLRRHRRPSFASIGMVIDHRNAGLEEARETKRFPFWFSLNIPKGSGSESGLGSGSKQDDVEDRKTVSMRTVLLPCRDNPMMRSRKGIRKETFQVFEKDDALVVGVATDVGEAFAESRRVYAETPSRTETISLDFGLSTLFASCEGDLFGRRFLETLKTMDATIEGIGRHVARSGKKLKDSKRWRHHVARLRAFVSDEIGRVLNRVVKVHHPREIVVEALRFHAPDLSRRMNRLVTNCGRKAVSRKLASLEQEFGITVEEVHPHYTSKTCSSCRYVDARNRRSDLFECLFCGFRCHADVNAARNFVEGRSFDRSGSLRTSRSRARSSMRETLAEAVRRFDERFPVLSRRRTGRSGDDGVPSDPRETNRYWIGRPLTARSSALVGSNPSV